MSGKTECDILVVEDNISFQKTYLSYLKPEFEIQAVSSFSELESILDSHLFKIVFLDFNIPRRPGGNAEELGFQSLELIKDKLPDSEVIFVTGTHKDIETAVEAIKRGASNYIEKEKLNRERLFSAVTISLKNHEIKKKNRQLTGQVQYFKNEQEKKYQIQLKSIFVPGELHFEKLIGKSQALLEVCKKIETVSQSEIANHILITGERGTGKEIVAASIHFESKRKNLPLFTANISAFNKDIMESELFGHEKGAFTGATARKIGLFEMAQGSTLFIDEVAEIPLPVQAKLLRTIQFGEISRVGSPSAFQVNVKNIYATNRNLNEEIEKDKFRADLYDRLNEVSILLPPLRDRAEDIPLLARYYVELYRIMEGMDGLAIAPDAMCLLQEFDWPGNVRQLEKFAKRLVIFKFGNTINIDHIKKIAGEEGLRKINTTKVKKEGGNGGLANVEELLRQFNVRTLTKVPDVDLKISAFLRACIENSGNLSLVEKETGLSHKTVFDYFTECGGLIKKGWEESGGDFEKLAEMWGVPLDALKSAFSKNRVQKILASALE